MPESRRLRCVVVGEESLLIQCSDLLLARGHEVIAVVASNARIHAWCRDTSIPCLARFEELAGSSLPPYDYLFSIANLRVLPEWLLSQPRRMAINFHDAPLPARAGLNAPVWALLEGETTHGICWHRMQRETDAGPLLVERSLPILPDDTAFTLNARCYEAALDGFGELVQRIEAGTLVERAQEGATRRYHARDDRPERLGVLDWCRSADALARLVRALDHGPYRNPLTLPTLLPGGGELLLVRRAEITPNVGGSLPGTVLAAGADEVTIACGEQALRCTALTDARGTAADVAAVLARAGVAVGARLPLGDGAPHLLDPATSRQAVRDEPRWRRALADEGAVQLPFGRTTAPGSDHASDHAWVERELAIDESRAGGRALALLALLFSRLTGEVRPTFAFVPAAATRSPSPLLASVVPLGIAVDEEATFDSLQDRAHARLAEVESWGRHLADLPARDPAARAATDPATIPVRIVRADDCAEQVAREHAGGSALTVLVPARGATIGFLVDRAQLPAFEWTTLLATFDRLRDSVATRLADPIGTWPLVDEEEDATDRHASEAHDDARGAETSETVHQAFERQVARTPERVACHCQDESLTYDALNRRANRLAYLLRERGVAPGTHVGILIDRSTDMLVAMYAVLKAGGAYVPLDPAYPSSRLDFMIEDAALGLLLCDRPRPELGRTVPQLVLSSLSDAFAAAPDDDTPSLATGSDLAYTIYTSGSTGHPKGVMIEHRNVLDFYRGMDERIGGEPGTWVAATSISFDISVLELFWTLARGFTVVLHADRHLPARASSPRGEGDRGAKALDFSFFYWNVTTGEDVAADKYRLLLESARFADDHGFHAVWTPERHFESFGGLFPNPSVVSAALAMITRRVALRAGSCVVPLHSPIRVAEEWAVVDNLSGGRAGVALAAGWAAPDFAIRPEAYARAKVAMFESAEVIRRLWRGETVPFPGPLGEVAVHTLPRPLQAELPLWITTAGNVETYRRAGAIGANVLTHLLGQTIDEVKEKVRAYREARRDAGHAGDGVVTLMLHTFVGPDARAVEEAVREPFKRYLRSAMTLVKAAAWQFPTYTRVSAEQGKAFDEYFADAPEEEVDALLEFAFQRYARTSGLMGTIDSCMAMVESVRSAGVDEIACLIDFGVPTDTVLAHLPNIAALQQRARDGAAGAAEAATAAGFTLPTLFERHGATHFQCTPTMARLFLADPRGRAALGTLRHLMVGGEALPPDLARELRAVVSGRVTNMYGPTETTIWSTTAEIADAGARVTIGTALRGESVLVVDARMRCLPPGVVGELAIGGAGVARGYWRRPELTAERFVTRGSEGRTGKRFYRTGDLGRVLPDGRLECLGRVDQQVKLRGHRIEPGELEAALREEPGVRDAIVIVREDTPGDRRLVGYVTGRALDPDALRAALQRRLPEIMVPAVVVPLPNLPLTPNGKLDRRSLPPPVARSVSTDEPSAPRGGSEAVVTSVWQEALGLTSIGTRENFFDIGGHSLLAVQVLTTLRARVDAPLQLTDIFRHPTIEALARYIDGAAAPALGSSRGVARAEARRASRARRG